MAETLCPSCGLSPLPAGVERCPRCGEPFDHLPSHKKRTEENESESTTFGGNVTSAVTAHPLGPVAVLLAGAAMWAVRAIATDAGQLAFAGVLLDLAAAALIFFTLGPAVALAGAALVFQLGLVVFLSHGELLTAGNAFAVLHLGVAISMLSGEPSERRRKLSTIAGLTLAAAAAVASTIGPLPGGPVRQELVSREGGYRLLLPAGYTVRPAEELAPDLLSPAAAHPGWQVVAFAGGEDRGLVVVDRSGGEASASCSAVHQAVGGVNSPRPLSVGAPAVFGAQPISYELKTAHASGRLTCAVVGGRLLALAVVSARTGVVGAQVAFDEVGAGLSLK